MERDDPRVQLVDRLSQDVQKMSMKVQKDIVERLKMQDFHNECMQRCNPLISAAQAVMDLKQQRQ